MSLHFITGGAGTGKTTRLLRLVEDWLATHPLREGQSVLALTFMHGSRIRLSERLGASVARGRSVCATLDSFAREVCARWRTRLAFMGIELPSEDARQIYAATCDAAAKLLEDRTVAEWVAASHPLVIVDEFQDCHEERPKLVHQLSLVADVLVAADPFQDLGNVGTSPALVMLAASGAPSEDLVHVHRTNMRGLLAAATALREGRAIEAGTGLSIEVAPSHHVAAAKICRFVADLRGMTAAVVSAGAPAPKNFARMTLEAASATRGYGKHKNLGPYTVPWESSPDTHRSELLAALELDDGFSWSPAALAAALPASNPLTRFMLEWLERDRKLNGRATIPTADVRLHVLRAEAAYRSMPRRVRGVSAMTIHQAKNREFDHVAVLWGHHVPSNAELRRRWLYNAITRAKRFATVIVQGASMLNHPPFAA